MKALQLVTLCSFLFIADASTGFGGRDISCPSSVNIQDLRRNRLDALQKYVDLPVASSFAQYEMTVRALWDTSEPSIELKTTWGGKHIGIENVLEHGTMLVVAANGGYVRLQRGKLKGVKNDKNGALSAVSVHKMEYNRLKHTTEIRLSLWFKPCSKLIRHVEMSLDKGTVLLLVKGASSGAICAAHARWCNVHRQYATFQDCVGAIDELPRATCGKRVFAGNSALCRFAHSFMVRWRPGVHCAHLASMSSVCIDSNCGKNFEACHAHPGDSAYSPRLHPRCCRPPYCTYMSRCAWKGQFKRVAGRCKKQLNYKQRGRKRLKRPRRIYIGRGKRTRLAFPV